MLSNFFSRLFSKTFLAGVLSGAVLAVGGLYAYAQVRVRMGGTEQPDQKPYVSPVDLTDSTAVAVQGTVPSDWVLRSVDGAEDTTFGALTARPTLLTVGAGWCEPCRAEGPVLEVLHDSTEQDLRVMFVSPEPRDSVRRYVEDEGYSMPAYAVDDLPSVLHGELLPRTYLVRSNGAVVYRHVGPAEWNPDVVHRLLKQSRTSAAPHPPPESVVETPHAAVPH